jgi:tellurite resistance protein
MSPFPPTLRPEPFWTRTSPALFPVCMGLLGAGLAWREAGRGAAAASAMAEAWLGAALAIFAFCLAIYARKIARRPGALGHDLRMPAGRGAVPAISVGGMLAAAALAPVAPGAATAVWFGALVLHAALVGLLTRELFALPPDGRPATAPLFVAYAGYVVAPGAGAALGWSGLSWALLAVGTVGWLGLLPFVLRRLATRAAPPPPLRPGAAVLLAPPAMVAVALDRLGGDPRLQALCWAVAAVTLAGLLWRARWLTAGGWTPAWGAFTFPACAFAAATSATLGATGPGLVATALTVTAASLATLYVAGRTADAWAKGKLAPA